MVQAVPCDWLLTSPFPARGGVCVWEGRTACPRPPGETAPMPRPANLSCQLFLANGRGGGRVSCSPHPVIGGHKQLGSKPSEEWVMLLAEIRPAGTHHTLGLCCGGGGRVSLCGKAHVSC